MLSMCRTHHKHTNTPTYPPISTWRNLIDPFTPYNPPNHSHPHECKQQKSPSLTPQPSPQLNLNNSTSLLSPYHHHHKLSKSSATLITCRKMATSITSAAIVAGLGTSPLSSPKRVTLSSGFIKSRVAASNPLKQAMASGGRFTCFERDWLRTDLNVIGFGLIGWLAPSSVPVINGNSLTGLFFSSIGEELSHFPTGPALTSPFWLWLVTWHLGLFLCLTFGQIGFKGRTESYF